MYEKFLDICSSINEYEELLLKKSYKGNENIFKTYEDYRDFLLGDNEKEKTSNISLNDLKDRILKKEEIEKDIFVFNIYIIKVANINLSLLDKNYEITESDKYVYECGAILSINPDSIDKKSNDKINGLFTKQFNDLNDGDNYYNYIKEFLNNSSIDKIINNIKKDINISINNIKND
ncbi:MAG: hypothetical protein Q4G04_00440 [bacterium]|nr:hypothetical protein [bacterium]